MSMRVAVTGSSGLVGSALVKELGVWGYDVLRLVRSKGKAHADDAILWDYINARVDTKALSSCDVVVHLAGDNVASGRWTAAKKEKIRNSRVLSTQHLCHVLADAEVRPKVFVCASAIGYYGDRGDELLDEQAGPGSGFLPSVVQEWEDATLPLRNAGVRVVNLRIGMVLSRSGGALKKMWIPFWLGLGGVMGSGQQYMSWITLEDLIGVIHHVMTHDELQGPVNAIAPESVTNTVFTKALGKAMCRPTVFPMPAFAARLAFGEMADALLLASTRVAPKQLERSGYVFQAPDIASALQQVL